MEGMEMRRPDYEDDPSVGSALENSSEKTERRIRDLEKSSETDSLTGLLNRSGLKAHAERLRDNLEKKRREGDPTDRKIVFALGDIDKFKAVNDTFGHAAGDKVLQAGARSLKSNIRAGDIVGRNGGEEFVLALTIDSGASAERIVDAVREAVERTEVTWEGRRIPITMSFGIADGEEMPEDSLDEEETEREIHRADKAMYAAKRRGRNCAVLFSRMTPKELQEAA